MKMKFSKSDEKATPETTSENSPVFSPSDMEKRWKKLKAEGKVPPLATVLKVIQTQTDEINNAPSTLNRCRRSNGTLRAWFATAAQAVAFAENPADVAYQGD